MKSINMGEQYFKGVLAGYLGANYMCGPITEWQIDIIGDGGTGSLSRGVQVPKYPRYAESDRGLNQSVAAAA